MLEKLSPDAGFPWPGGAYYLQLEYFSFIMVRRKNSKLSASTIKTQRCSTVLSGCNNCSSISSCQYNQFNNHLRGTLIGSIGQVPLSSTNLFSMHRNVSN